MRARYHVLVSAGLSLGVLALSKSYPASIACFVSGALIDLDHYWDYYILRKRWPLDYKELVEFCNPHRERKIYLFFHAYEFLILLWLAIYVLNLNAIWVGLALGLTVHMFCDQFTNPIKPLFYFLTYRIINRFEKTRIIPEKFWYL